jgi:hypothetical protein
MRVFAIIDRASWGIAVSPSCAAAAGEEFLKRLWFVDAPRLSYCVNLLFWGFRVIMGEGLVCVWGRIGAVAILRRRKITWTTNPGMYGSLVAMLVAGGGACIKRTVMMEH